MILLTSKSPRRKELLEQIGFREKEDFVQGDIPVPFEYQPHGESLTLQEVQHKAEQAARLKVMTAVQAGHLTKFDLPPDETVLLGADTVFYLNGNVLDRPLLVQPAYATPGQILSAEKRARKMLEDLRRERHFDVVTGLAAAQGNDPKKARSCWVTTRGSMRQFSNEDIERYIQTREPLDKTGGVGIQERGVVLFDKIEGSYSNVVGLPLVEFMELLSDPLFEGRVGSHISRREPSVSEPVMEGVPELRVISVGDINYDIVFNKLPEGFFKSLQPPGRHIPGELDRATGGTGPIFALKARSAGFTHCSVLGVVGGDALGKFIEEDLNRRGIKVLLPADYSVPTGIALVLRDLGRNDTLLTITDSNQALSADHINQVKPEIGKTDLLFVSGYCLTDPTRRGAVCEAMNAAKDAGKLVVLDVTSDMEKSLEFSALLELTAGRVDVLVSEIPQVLAWLGHGDREQNDWDFITERVVPELIKHFSTVFLRTSGYSHEVIASRPDRIGEPRELDYSARPPEQRLGYADEITARHLYQFMSPRLLMASASPRRLALLKQIVAANKIEVLPSKLPEEMDESEDPAARVTRLALAKARKVASMRGEFSPSIEVVIGADTEIALDGQTLGQPADDQAARLMLRKLSGRTHEAITSLALIDLRTGAEVQDCVRTRVEFKPLSDREIEEYVQSGEPLGKAGGYGIQGKGALFIKSIDGSYSNVVGLPLERLSQLLSEEFKMPVWDIDRVSNWSFPHSSSGGESAPEERG